MAEESIDSTCDCGGLVAPFTGPLPYKGSGLSKVFVFGSPGVTVCESCGLLHMELAQLIELHRKIGLQLLCKEPALVGEEIRFVSGMMHWSDDLLNRVMGVARGSIEAWRDEQRQMGLVEERLLRVLVAQHQGLPLELATIARTTTQRVGPLELRLSRLDKGGWVLV